MHSDTDACNALTEFSFIPINGIRSRICGEERERGGEHYRKSKQVKKRKHTYQEGISAINLLVNFVAWDVAIK